MNQLKMLNSDKNLERMRCKDKGPLSVFVDVSKISEVKYLRSKCEWIDKS